MRKCLLFFSFLVTIQCVFSQVESKYSHYTINQLLINPAIAGSEKNMVNTFAYRNQWINSGTKLHQKSLTCHLPFNQKRMGIGLILLDESSKNQQVTQVSTNLSYKINAFKGLLAFGLEGGFIQQKVDFSSLLIKDDDDPFARNINLIEGDFSTGIFYQNQSFFLGFSGKHLAFNEIKNSYFLHTIYAYEINSSVKMIPSFLLKYHQQWNKALLDLNIHFKMKEQYWIGIAYQSSHELSLQTGLLIHKINQKISRPIFIGYNYDYGFSALYPTNNGGSHEIVLKIHVKSRPNPSHILNKKRYVSPLFF